MAQNMLAACPISFVYTVTTGRRIFKHFQLNWATIAVKHRPHITGCCLLWHFFGFFFALFLKWIFDWFSSFDEFYIFSQQSEAKTYWKSFGSEIFRKMSFFCYHQQKSSFFSNKLNEIENTLLLNAAVLKWLRMNWRKDKINLFTSTLFDAIDLSMLDHQISALQNNDISCAAQNYLWFQNKTEWNSPHLTRISPPFAHTADGDDISASGERVRLVDFDRRTKSELFIRTCWHFLYEVCQEIIVAKITSHKQTHFSRTPRFFCENIITPNICFWLRLIQFICFNIIFRSLCFVCSSFFSHFNMLAQPIFFRLQNDELVCYYLSSWFEM